MGEEKKEDREGTWDELHGKCAGADTIDDQGREWSWCKGATVTVEETHAGFFKDFEGSV